jgi:hypothetical protein
MSTVQSYFFRLVGGVRPAAGEGGGASNEVGQAALGLQRRDDHHGTGITGTTTVEVLDVSKLL